MTDSRYRVGLIGAGRKGTSHARAYVIDPRADIVAVADNDEENRELFCRRFPGVTAYEDHQQMLATESLDVAAPILPVRPNPQVVLDCVPHVRGIFCEKPLAASLEDADRVVEACERADVRFAAGDLDRNLPGFHTAHEYALRHFGEPRSITFFGGSGTEMSGGGCQIFSLMRMFAGDVDAEFAIGWVTDDPASDEDQGGAGVVRFVNGFEGHILRQPDGRGRGFEAAFQTGIVRYENQVLSLWSAPEHERLGADLVAVEAGLSEGSVYGRRPTEFDDDGWRWPGDRNVASVARFLDSFEAGIDPGGSGDNGRKVLELAIAIRESHRRDHAAVRLPLEDRSLQMVPGPSRMDNKKPILGHGAYMEQLGSHTNF